MSAHVGVGLLLSVFPASAAEIPRPRIACGRDHVCILSTLPPVLDDSEVLGYLKSGLTTTLAVTVTTRDAQGRRLRAAGRIDMQFEPWEEIFDVVVTMGSGGSAKQRVSEAGLAGWWRALRLTFPLTAAARGKAGIDIDVIPFSEEEEADTRRWYAETLRRGDARTDAPSALAPMFDAFTLSSIKRQGVVRFTWNTLVEDAR